MIKKYLRTSLLAKVALFVFYKFKKFENSQKYWESRYQKGGNSGVGSYDNSAHFKASIINNFVKQNNISYIDELGCGDGNQLTFAKYQNYVGYDVSETILEKVKIKFKDDNSKQFFNISDYSRLNSKLEAVLSLDVIYHLIEDEIFKAHMERLFDGYKFVIIFSTNFNDRFYNSGHVKNRKFTDWINKNVSDYKLIEQIDNIDPYSKVNFYIFKKIV